MELRILLTELRAVEEQQRRAPVGLRDQTGDQRDEHGHAHQEWTHVVADHGPVFRQRRGRSHGFKVIRARPVGRVHAQPRNQSGQQPEDCKQDHARHDDVEEHALVVHAAEP